MAKDMARPDDAIWIDFGEGEQSLSIRKDLVERVKNRAEVEMWRYHYWEIYTSKRTHRISEPEDYKRIVGACNRSDVLFVEINGAIVNKRDIREVSPMKTGHRKVKE